MTPDGIATHACDRALERYGITLALLELRELEGRLSRGEGMALRRNPDRAEVRVVKVSDQLVTLVWIPEQQRIKTFLPADAPFTRPWKQPAGRRFL